MTESFITQEDIERLKARDKRIADLDRLMQIEAELRDSLGLKLVIEAATRRADEALEKLVNVDATDTKKVLYYQAQVQCARMILETFKELRDLGEGAMAALEQGGNIKLDD